ncbi:hypothetical protein AOLI_G00200850 [Acnodon oligacanthus]
MDTPHLQNKPSNIPLFVKISAPYLTSTPPASIRSAPDSHGDPQENSHNTAVQEFFPPFPFLFLKQIRAQYRGRTLL